MPVAARFHEIRDRVVAAVDAKFGEPIRLSPMKNGVSDPDRQQVVLEAVLRVGEGATTSVTGGSAQSWRSRIVAGKAQLHINLATYEGPPPRQGDIVRALSRHGQPAFVVSDIDDRSHTRLVLNLSEK